MYQVETVFKHLFPNRFFLLNLTGDEFVGQGGHILQCLGVSVLVGHPEHVGLVPLVVLGEEQNIAGQGIHRHRLNAGVNILPISSIFYECFQRNFA